MDSRNIPDSASLFLGGAIAIVLSWLASGCRIGSYEERSQIRASNPDTLSGYYLAQPQTLKLYATTHQTKQTSGTVSLIPQEIGKFITNPVAFIVQDLKTGVAGLTSPTGKTALPIYINPDNTLEYTGTSGQMTYWKNSECQNYLEITETGRLLPSLSVKSPIGNTLPLSGNIQLNIHVINKFTGQCNDSFKNIAQCYQDSSQCGGKDSTENDDLQATVVDLFRPWIESKAMTSADIPDLVNYAYEVSYQ